MEKTIVGIDIGGTTIKIGFLNEQGGILDKWEIPTNNEASGMYIVDEIWESVKQQLHTHQLQEESILGIGIGAPGFINGETGFVYEAVNIGWKDVELAQLFKDKAGGIPVYVENDANIAVLGENWLGAGKQAKNMIAITLGTGVGGGIIANGMILNGVNGTAGEIGHMTVVHDGYACNCGRYGCLETIASATGIVRQAMDLMEGNPTSQLAVQYKKTGAITTKDIFDLAKKGDAMSQGIILHTADTLGLVIANLATVINPSKVLIGGGVSKAGDQILQPIIASFKKYALSRVSEVCEINIAQLGNDAGIIGAAYLVKKNS